MYKVSSDFVHGNVCAVSVCDGDVPEIHFTPHPHGGTEALWFCFRISRDGAGGGKKIRLVLDNPRNLLGWGCAGKAYPVKRDKGGEWERFGPDVALDKPDGGFASSWEIDAPDDYCDIAYCFPHGPAEIGKLVADCQGYWKADAIGVSQGGREIIRLSNDYGNSDASRKGVYLVSHQHASEMSGAWVIDGVLRRLAGYGDKAPLVWSVPITNIDGVVEGDYGKDPFPCDLNRAWGSPTMRYETLVISRDMHLWKNRCAPAFAMDFHSPGALEDDGLYAFLPKKACTEELFEKVQKHADCCAEFLGEDLCSGNFSRVANYPSRFGHPNFTQFCSTSLSLPSFSTETPYCKIGERVLTVADYHEAGARIADFLVNRFGEK